MAGRVSERIRTVQQIAAELDKRYSYQEIDEFVSAFGLGTQIDNWEDTYDYARQLVARASDSVLSEIIDDLGISASSIFTSNRQMPSAWENENKVRVFISHLSSQKEKAVRLRDVMKAHGMSGFVAHEDIKPTLDWQVQIERALNNMELFVSMHTKGSTQSIWMQQEIGYAVALGTRIIALRMEEDPTGFIQKHQALSRGKKTAEEVVDEILGLVKNDDRLKDRFARPPFDDLDDVPF